MNNVFRKYLSVGMIAAASSGLFGCFPEDDFQNLEVVTPSPKVSLPLLNTSLTLGNLLDTNGNENSLVENSDKSYSLRYSKTVSSPNLEEFFPEIPDQHFNKEYSLGIDAPSFFSDSISTTYQDEIPCNFDGLNVYQIEPKDGMLLFDLGSTYEHDVKVKLTFPNIVSRSGDALVQVFNLYSWDTHTIRREIPLNDYTIHLDSGKLEYDLDFTIYGGTGNPISSDQGVSFEFGLSDIAFAYLEGNFNNINIPIGADTLLIPAFNGTVEGDVALQPSLSLDIHNSFGVKVKPDMSKIFINSMKGDKIKLADEGNSKFFTGDFEILSPTNREDISVTTQKIDKNNSNIEDAFASVPEGLYYDLGFMLASGESDTSFVSDKSQVSVDIETEIPLEGSFELTMVDTMEVDFSELAESLEELKVLIKTENSFPIDAYLQIYFLDADYNMINDASGQPLALFSDSQENSTDGARFLQAATIIDTNSGKTQVDKIDMPISATISDTKILDSAKYFMIQASVRSTDQANTIKLYSFYDIRFSMAMQMKASL